MTDKTKPSKERLYLDKEREKEIYVDSCHLPRHQIEGIRYLYRQYTKSKPGVILNNPSGFGKSLQITLFLESIRKLIKNRVLILCDDDKTVFNWKQTVGKWTKYTEDDIVIDASYVYPKKIIFLTKFTNLAASYSTRDWDVVVVKSDFLPKQLASSPLKTMFKIWLTTVDMRKDLEMFNSIYCWLYGEKKFNVNSYIGSLSDVEGQPLIRAKLMNAFLEDVVYMNNELHSNTPELIDVNTSKEKVSRKNKDATGTKIKRSKTTKESDVTDGNNLDTFNTNIETNVDSIRVTNSKQDLNINHNMDYETSNSVRDDGLIECEQYPTDTENLSFNALNDLENENDVNDIHSESILDDEMFPSDEQNKNLNISNTPVSSTDTSINADKDTKTANSLKKINKKDIFEAISEMEEAMKKFKGSILDKLF